MKLVRFMACVVILFGTSCFTVSTVKGATNAPAVVQAQGTGGFWKTGPPRTANPEFTTNTAQPQGRGATNAPAAVQTQGTGGFWKTGPPRTANPEFTTNTAQPRGRGQPTTIETTNDLSSFEEDGATTGPKGMVWIKPGTFTMGSPYSEDSRSSDEGPPALVTISRGFWMSKYETTQEEYQALMGTNPSHFRGNSKNPVEQVSWWDAVGYCAALTAREHLQMRLPAGYVYRLPTEAEWEYCCRAGTTTATPFGSSLSSWQANFNGGNPYGGGALGPYLETTLKVGSFAPNGWGLYDMHGNVWEWCLDWYGNLPRGAVTDPRGPNVGWLRTLRGGSWAYDGHYCRAACRFFYSPSYRCDFIGFRPVLAPAW